MDSDNEFSPKTPGKNANTCGLPSSAALFPQLEPQAGQAGPAAV